MVTWVNDKTGNEVELKDLSTEDLKDMILRYKLGIQDMLFPDDRYDFWMLCLELCKAELKRREE